MDVIDQIQAARRNLLDLSMRNRLLHFRPNKRRSIRVVDEMPNEVYDLLVLNERVMDFKARPSEQELPLGESDTSLGDESSVGTNEGLEGSAELSSIWELHSSGEQIPAKYVDRFLQTILDTETLQKRLFYINQQARSVFEEQGYSVLFLALGFLEWKESPDATEVRKAPLLLVPVELERAGVQKSFRLKWTGEEVFSNVSLSEKLKDIGVFLPSFQMPEEKSEVETYFDAVVETIKKMIGWRVLSDLYLDFFSFTKFVMYKDLDPKSWPSESELVDHALLKAVMEPSELNAKNEGFLPEDVDHKLAMKDLFHVMDADPFQVAVLEDIKSGFNLVVEGPPGTGKSQTIANAIAELLAAGKTVLFVSEKMAALEVVKNRLDHVGLGQFCLEIHSRKASKKDLLKELELSIQNPAPKGSTQTDSIEEIESLRKELNEYARGLREPVGKLGRSPFGLFQMKEAANREFTRAGKPMPRVSWNNPGEHSNEDWNQALVCVKELSEIGTLVKPINKHPWRGCMPGLVLPTDEEEILIELRQCIAAISKLKNSAAMLANEARLAGVHTPKRIERAIQAGMLIAHTMRVEKDVLQNEDWDRSNGHAMCLIRQVADCQAAIGGVLTRFKRGALEEDVRGLLDQFRSQLIRHRRFFTLRWWRLVNKLRSLYKVRAPWKSKALIPDFERLLSAIDKRVEIRAQSERARALFGRLWDQERSQTRILSNFSEWITRFRPFIREGIVSDETLDLISSKGGNKNLEVVVNEVGALLKTFLEIRDGYFQRVGLSYGIAFGVEVANLELELLDERLRLHEASIRDLQKWSQYVAYREKTRATMANPVVEVLELDQVDPTNLVACFKGNFADSLLREAFKERPILGAFIGDLHEKKINRFGDLDRSIIQGNRHRLIERLYQNKPEIVGGLQEDLRRAYC